MGAVYLYPGMLFAEPGEHEVTTVLGSCVAVCLWDPRRRVGGMNHFLLPLWNGEGLASPRYGNVAIGKLIAHMRELGCPPRGLQAKVFGGGAVVQSGGGLWSVGERNVTVAADLLGEAGIPVVGQDVGGAQSRRIRFITATGEVFLRRVPPLAKAGGAAAGPDGRGAGR